HTDGKYSLLVVIGAEIFEFLVQSYNADVLARYQKWTILRNYGTLIFANFTIFGICMLSDERFVSAALIITIDVVIDASYIVFNLEFIDNPASYWAVIMPLFLSVDMLNDSFTLHALKSVKQNLYKQGVRAKHEESKANGTLERDLLVAAAKRFNAGADNNRREIRPPAGFEELGPR
ncbi:hypothetical protein TeGR_g3670, partial [Tetraparma gracilis]